MSRTLRVAADQSEINRTPIDARTGRQIFVYQGNDLKIEFALFDAGQMVDVSSITNLHVQIKALSDTGNTPALASVEVTSFDDTLDAATWGDESKQHGFADFTGLETSLPAGVYRLCIWDASDSKQITYLSGEIKIAEDSAGTTDVANLPLDTGWFFKGFWDADTNTPVISNASGGEGDFFVTQTAGSVDFGDGLIDFLVNDRAVHDGSEWVKVVHPSNTPLDAAIAETDANAATSAAAATAAAASAASAAATDIGTIEPRVSQNEDDINFLENRVDNLQQLDFPDPQDPNFKSLIERGFVDRLSLSPIDRGTTYYISNSTGDDSNDGTKSNPWKTLAKVQATIDDASFAGDTAFLFKMDDEWRELVYINDNGIPGVTFASYGRGAKKPLINHFTEQYPAANGGWSLYSGTTYSRAETSEIAYVCNRADPYDGVLHKANSVANCEATANSYYWLGDELFINLDGVDPDTLDLEAAPDAYTTGFVGSAFRVSGNGARIHNLHTRGSGADRGPITTQNEGFKSLAEGDNYVAFTYCDAYYGSTHSIAHYSPGAGGHLTVIGCKAGLCRRQAAGCSIFNNYAPNGGNSAWFGQCLAHHPSIPATGETTTKAQGFYAHSSGPEIKNFIAYECEVDGCGLGAGNNSGTGESLRDCLSVFVSCKQAQVVDTQATLPLNSGLAYINCVLEVAASTVTSASISTQPWKGWMVNSVLLIDMAGKTSGKWGITNESSTSNGRIIHSAIEFFNTSSQETNLSYNYHWKEDFLIANSIIQKRSDWTTSRLQLCAWWTPSSLYIDSRNNAFSGVRTDNGGSASAVNSVVDDTKTLIDTSKILDDDYYFEKQSSELKGGGDIDYSIPYDLFWAARSKTSPTIGPLER